MFQGRAEATGRMLLQLGRRKSLTMLKVLASRNTRSFQTDGRQARHAAKWPEWLGAGWGQMASSDNGGTVSECSWLESHTPLLFSLFDNPGLTAGVIPTTPGGVLIPHTPWTHFAQVTFKTDKAAGWRGSVD